MDDSRRGYRRVVPSPNPIQIIEQAAIKRLFESGIIVIACGGGGIPVVQDEQERLQRIRGVIDKDYAATTLATLIGAEILLILTDVAQVFLNYGKPNQTALDTMMLKEAQRYLREGHFLPGSMGPKVESAIRFVESGGEKAIITSLEYARQALKETAGTTIYRDA